MWRNQMKGHYPFFSHLLAPGQIDAGCPCPVRVLANRQRPGFLGWRGRLGCGSEETGWGIREPKSVLGKSDRGHTEGWD